jgi:large subunit ribosomal protein L21
MFAVIKTGGKQYRVAKDDLIVVEKLEAEAGKGVSFGDVLMVADGAKVSVGAPVVAGASVKGEVVEQRRGDKVKVFKKRRRSTYRRTQGHRQYETVVRITGITAG